MPKCFVDVSGTVTDVGTGAPIAMATVAGGGKSATTDDAGQYTMTEVPLGANNAPINLQVTGSRNAPANNQIGTYWSKTASVALVCERPATLDLTLLAVEPATLEGAVVEGQLDANGSVVPVAPPVPVVGATATIPLVGNAITDAAGEYAFRDSTGTVGLHLAQDNAPLSGEVVVSGPSSLPLRQRYWPATIQAGQIDPGASVQAPTAALVRQCTASVGGRVTDSLTGAAVADTTVRVTSVDTRTNDTATARTAADGTYQVPEVLFGFNNTPSPLRVIVTKNGFVNTIVESGTVGCGSSADVPVSLTNPALFFGAVTGRVTDGETGAAIAGATVRASGCVIERGHGLSSCDDSG